MKDAMGKTLQVGDDVIHIYSSNGRACAMAATIIGFTAQRVRFAWERGGQQHSAISVPTNFIIVPPGAAAYAADRAE